MPRQVDIREARKRLEEALSKIPERYRRKIEKAIWKEAATSEEAEKLWAEALEKAIAAMRRKKALERVDEREWKDKAIKLGSKRIAEGIRENLDKWEERFKPYADVLSSLELPPKSADPMENVVNRVGAVVKALVEKKKEILGEA